MKISIGNSSATITTARIRSMPLAFDADIGRAALQSLGRCRLIEATSFGAGPR